VLRLILSVIVFLTPLSFASALVIDDFDGSQTVQAHPTEEVTGGIATSSAIGGARHIRAVGASGLGALYLRANIIAGLYSHSQDATVTGTSLLTWDGETSDALTPGGLGGIDLTQDGATAFILDVLSFDFSNSQPLPLTLTIYDSGDPTGNRWSRSTLTLTSAVTTLTPFSFPFASFVTHGPNGAARIDHVGAISLLIEGLNVADRDLTLERVRTNGACALLPDVLGRVIDVCGMCGGDGTSCLDCKGVPYGKTEIDRCDVCGGDGSSCLGCAQSDLFQLLTSLDGGAKKQEKIIKKMLKLLGRRAKDAATKRYILQTKPAAHTLQVRNWTLSWTIPSTNNTCSNQILCSARSYQFVIDEYRVHNEELRVLSLEVLSKLEAASAGTAAARAKFLKQITETASANLALAAQVPVQHYSCS